MFHHFGLGEKVAIVRRYLAEHLAPGGLMVIADISFETLQALESCRSAAGELWEEEPYWVAEEAALALESAGAAVEYVQVAECAGVYGLASATLSPL